MLNRHKIVKNYPVSPQSPCVSFADSMIQHSGSRDYVVSRVPGDGSIATTSHDPQTSTPSPTTDHQHPRGRFLSLLPPHLTPPKVPEYRHTGRSKTNQITFTPQNCDNSRVQPWKSKKGADIFAHIANTEKLVEAFRYYPDLMYNSSCADYRNSTQASTFVLPNLCTQCQGRDLYVTLTLPMTDNEVMWHKLAHHVTQWNGPISVGLLLGHNKTRTLFDEDGIISLLSQRIRHYNIESSFPVCFHAVFQNVSNTIIYMSIF